MRSVTARTPTVYRIQSVGVYGTTQTTLEAVVDFGKTIRRLPSENALKNRTSDPEELGDLMDMLKEENQTMPIGRYVFWRQY